MSQKRNLKGQFVKGIVPWNKGKKWLERKGNTDGFKKGQKTRLGMKHTKATKEKLREIQIGQHHSPETEFKKGQLKNEKHFGWKGDEVKYGALHSWIARQKGKASNYQCEHCEKPAKHWANVDHKYKRNINDFIPLCEKCHRKYDIKNNLIKLRYNLRERASENKRFLY